MLQSYRPGAMKWPYPSGNIIGISMDVPLKKIACFYKKKFSGTDKKTLFREGQIILRYPSGMSRQAA